MRAGHAIGQRYDIHGKSPVRDCSRDRISTIFWGMGLPIFILSTLQISGGGSLLLLLSYAVLWHRGVKYRLANGDSSKDSLLYANFMIIAKFANAVGLIKFFINRLTQRYRIIEYK